MDNIGIKWKTEHGQFEITKQRTIKWIMKEC